MKNFKRFHFDSMRTQSGFSILEIFISLVIGIALLSGVLSVFVGMKTTTSETSGYGELQENGRFALSIIADDLMKADFWGDYAGTFDAASVNGVVPGAPAIDCVGEGINNATFPAAAGQFRTLWGHTVKSSNTDPLGCFANTAQAKVGSDLVQLKRVISSPVVATPANNFYLMTNLSDGQIFAGGGAVPVIDNSQTWEYQHHVYYVTEQNQGNNKVPVLMQGRLTNTMSFSPLVDGIEMIKFMYGVDTDTNVDDKGVINAFISADNMTSALWNNAVNTKIVAVKVYVLARSVLPDTKYTNANTYQLGDTTYTPNDNYRRMLFTSTVTLFNARIDSW